MRYLRLIALSLALLALAACGSVVIEATATPNSVVPAATATLSGPLLPGMPAPAFELKDVAGASVRLADLRGQPVLLSFLNLLTDADSPQSSGSRSQIVFLRSMLTQYAGQGLRMLLVDASALERGQHLSEEQLINASFDLRLEGVPLLKDTLSPSLAQRYGVASAPTTFLIRADGVVVQRWEGFATAAQLAFAINDVFGLSPFGTPIAEGGATAGPGCADTPAQTRFAGLAGARPLSERIWLVDGGQPWQAGQPVNARWLVLDERRPLHLHVIGRGPSGEQLTLVDAELELVPEDEARGLLGGAAGQLSMHLAPLSIAQPGCYMLEAVVSPGGQRDPLLSGMGTITVR